MYQRLAAYNAWMTDKVYAAASQMSDAQRKEDRGAFFKSVHSTLNHLLFGDRTWLGRFTGKAYEVKGMGVDIYDAFDDLRVAHKEISQDIVTFTGGLSPDWLAADMSWSRSADGLTRTRPRWLLLTHMFNHQTHHRGQLSTLLTQAGADIGVTDLPFMPDLVEAWGDYTNVNR